LIGAAISGGIVAASLRASFELPAASASLAR
jgi:hypothetical protein